MTRGNQQIKQVYANLAGGEGHVPETIQWRIYQHAKRTKNVELGSYLAKRSDTVAEIDALLSKWEAAKIQAAWYMRPGRDKDVVRGKILHEDRVTVLEVVAGITGLDESVYEACARHLVNRVALPLISNESVGEETKKRAAAALAKEYDGLSYEKRNNLQVALAGCSPDVAGAFLLETRVLRVLLNIIGSFESITEQVELHILRLAEDTLDAAIEGRAGVKNSPKGSRNVNTWDEDQYPRQVSLVRDALQTLSRFPAKSSEARRGLLTKHVAFAKQLEKGRLGNYENEVHSDLIASIEHLGGSSEYSNEGIERMRNAKSSAEIIAIIEAKDLHGELDAPLLLTAVNNPNLDLAVATRIAQEMRWCGVDVDTLLQVKKDVYTVSVIGGLMTYSWGNQDELIEKLAGKHSTGEIWCAYVTASMADASTTGRVDHSLLESKYADKSVLPKLPFAVMTGDSLPEWMTVALSEYLEVNLPDEAAWDGFEALAKSHLGTLEQLVKAARLTTRKR